MLFTQTQNTEASRAFPATRRIAHAHTMRPHKAWLGFRLAWFSSHAHSLTTEARTVTSTGRAEDHDTEKDHYIPGFFQPEGEDDCIVTSQRFVRLPLYVDQVTACGDFLPTTRFFSAHLGRGFQPGAYPYPDPADRKAPEGEQKGP